MDTCALCKVDIGKDNDLTSPFREQHAQRKYFPERYAHICDSCLSKCHSGEITEEQWNIATAF